VREACGKLPRIDTHGDDFVVIRRRAGRQRGGGFEWLRPGAGVVPGLIELYGDGLVGHVAQAGNKERLADRAHVDVVGEGLGVGNGARREARDDRAEFCGLAVHETVPWKKWVRE